MSTVALLGNVSIAGAIPMLNTLSASLLAELQADLTAQASITANLQASLNMDLSAMLAAAASIQLSGAANIDVSIALPSLSVGLNADLAASLALSASIKAKLDILMGFTSLFATAGVRVFGYNGQVQEFGSVFTNYLGTGGNTGGMALTDQSYAIVMMTNSAATFTAMGQVVLA